MNVYPFVILLIVVGIGMTCWRIWRDRQPLRWAKMIRSHDERKPHMDEPKEVKIESDGRDIFVVVDGVRIATRGHPTRRKPARG
jgi:hypothetical protein